MSESVLDALVKLFALIGDIHDETVISSREKDIVRSFLARHLNNELVGRYMSSFEKYLELYNSENIKKGTIRERKRVSLNAMRILSICESINEELEQKQKIYILVQLTEYIALGDEITENELDFLNTVASAFFVSGIEFRNIRNFIMDKTSDIEEKKRVMIVDGNRELLQDDIKHLTDENLNGAIHFLNISSTNTLIIRYYGPGDLYLNGQVIFSGQTYIFDIGSTMRGEGIKTIYYSEIAGLISETLFDFRINLEAIEVNFKFRHSNNGIHNLNFQEESGKLVGILGSSGAGKSTSLSILNGTLKPQSGKVMINGYDLYNEKDKEYLHGIIGFVPQDDLLIEELTVFQNLWFNAKMCLGNLSEEKVLDVVNKTIFDFDLNEIRDLKVGNPLKKVISGGQRKRVNIALELMREPKILFVDEPTSGLSSVDSEMVMNLLKDQTYKGKLVIVNIHQPASDIYKMFDRIMIIDKGGYQVYYGNPTEAIIFFKTITNHANRDEDQCVKCGNINTDQLLRIIESKVIDEQGKATRIRKVNPQEWAEKFRDKYPPKQKTAGQHKLTLPGNDYSIPGLIKQTVIFFTRDLLSKIADRQYLLISLLGPPLLSLLLAYFIRSGGTGNYSFSDNDNIPPYLFNCVLTSLFFGLILSSDEILKDRKILKRESFLNLSWFSYLNSKIAIMFILSAIQTLSFILIGNNILEIRGMTLSYWMVLFTTSCFANLLGLNISSAFNSVITIYILIPIIIIPQLLFGGVMVKYDKLHLPALSSREYVPLIGNIMTARWSFEALAVEQFRNNKYEKRIFKYDMDVSQNDYYGRFLNDKLQTDLTFCGKYLDSADYSNLVTSRLIRLNYYINQLSGVADTVPGQWINYLNKENFNVEIKKEAAEYLELVKNIILDKRNISKLQVDSINASLRKGEGNDVLVELRNNYENRKLKMLVLDEGPGDKTFVYGDKIIQKYNPAYMKATSKWGRAHFYAPFKRLGNIEIDTYWFNISVIWLETILLYVVLYFNILQRLSSYFGTIRLTKSES